MKIAALLTGRGNNTLKDKNVLPVLGKPLLYYPAMAAKTSKYVTDLYVSSDDEKILIAAEEIGYKRILRPEELAKPDSQHVDAIIHALKFMEEKDKLIPDILIVLLANSGIVKSEWINESIENIIYNPEVSSSVPVYKEQDHHPFRAKQIDVNGFLVPYFDFSGKEISTNRQDLVPNFFLCHNFWTLNIRKSIFSDEEGQKPWTFLGNKIKPIVIKESFDVHTEEDLKRTEEWLINNNIIY